MWLEGFGDPTNYVLDIDTDRQIEGIKGRGKLNIGHAIIRLNNEDNLFYIHGQSQIVTGARIKLWAGFSNLVIPIFSGYTERVNPGNKANVVELRCLDFMGLLQHIEISGNQDPNNTAKLLMEYFCELGHLLDPVIASTDETTSSYTHPSFEQGTNCLRALELVCKTIFHIAFFDEDGRLYVRERESISPIDFTFINNNVVDCYALVHTRVLNSLEIEYRETFFSYFKDQASIDEYERHSSTDRMLLINSDVVTSKFSGSTEEELNYDLEAIKFTSASDASIIDCLRLKMKQDGAHGFITVKIYDDDSDEPGASLGTSRLKASGGLGISFIWEIFKFDTVITISPSTDYWIVIDISSVLEGAVYIQISAADTTGKHAYYSGTWHVEDNKQALHEVCGSRQAERIGEDNIAFYKDPHERIRIIAPAVPQLQLLDEISVDVDAREIHGKYVIEGRRHILNPENYTTIDTLRKIS